MKRLSFVFTFIACLILTACDKDDDQKLELTPYYLTATTWDAELSGTASPTPAPIYSHFVMQFLTTDTGKCIPTYDDYTYEGSFKYSITKDMITFNGSFVGNWTVVEHTNTRMVLQAFMPNEFKLVLTRK